MKRAERVEICTSEEAVRRYDVEQRGWMPMLVDCNDWFTCVCSKCDCCWSEKVTLQD